MENRSKEIGENAINQAFSLYENLLLKQNWEDLGVKDQVHGFRLSEGDHLYTKGIGTINHPPEIVANFLFNPSNKSQYNSHLESLQVLHDFGDLKIIHEVLKLHWPVSNRDTVSATKKIAKENGDFIILTKSIDIGFRPIDGNVRAEIIVGAFYLRNVEGIATEVTHISGTDPKGSVPGVFMNMMSKRRAYLINSLRSLIR